MKINGNSPVKREWLTTIVNVGSIASKHSKNSDVGIASSLQVLGAHWSIIFHNEFTEIEVKLLNGQPENFCHGHMVSPGQPLTRVYQDDL